jgi:S-DNA-T family DNA segregation ATPase FtsK/SpoIIIE
MTGKEAAKGQSRKKTDRPLPDLSAWFRILVQRGIVGVLLISLSIVTFVGLLQDTSGVFVDWLSGLILRLFGWGSYLVVLVVAGLGVLLTIGKMPDRKSVPWHIVAGAEIVFLAASGLIHLLVAGNEPWQAARNGYGCGYVGAAFSGVLSDLLGPGPTVVIIGAVLLWGLVVASGRSAQEWLERIEGWAQQGRERLGKLMVRLGSLSQQGERGATVEPPGSAPPPVEEATPTLPTMMSSPVRARRYKIVLPPLDLLEEPKEAQSDQQRTRETAELIERTLAHFDVPAKVIERNWGPRVTQFGVEPGYVIRRGHDGEETERKIRVAKIASLNNDLALALAAAPIRIEAPVPGRSIVGIEVPNPDLSIVSLRKGMSSARFRRRKSNLALVLGEGVAGTPIVADLARMPHLLIAGATGAGKSVCIGAIAVCLLFQNSPLTLRIVMIDPKRVEMARYNGLPHLYGRVESEAERVVSVLKWLVHEMQERYKKFAELGARHLKDYNRRWKVGSTQYLPRIVVMIDELADLMLFSPDQVENSICRLAQMARATGIHLIIATQRPSVDVVTGLIKANFPARIGFAVSSGTDSRVILDAMGADTLLGKGDMLYMSPDASKLVRVQGCFVSDAETERVINFWQEWAQAEEWEAEPSPWDGLVREQDEPAGDDLLHKAIEIVRQQGAASASMLQRRMHIGYPRAARLIDELEERGVVGPAEAGGRSRVVLDQGQQYEAEAPLSEG